MCEEQPTPVIETNVSDGCFDAEEDPSVISITDEVVKRLAMGPGGPNETEEGLGELDEHWMCSLKDMDDSHSCKNGLSEEEFYNMVQMVEGRFATLTNTNAACHMPMQKVFKCYIDNPQQSLMCAKEVRDFSACIDINTVEKIKIATTVICQKNQFPEIDRIERQRQAEKENENTNNKKKKK